MISQMNTVQNAARLAMADHRADPSMRPVSNRSSGSGYVGPALAGLLACAVIIAAVML